MTIKAGDHIPAATLMKATADGPAPITTDALFKDRTVVLFSVPGAFTPTCSAEHVPGFVKHLDELKAKKVDEVWCIATNDGFVMAAWGQSEKAIGKIRFLGDGSADFTRKLGLELDLTAHGMGVRSQRFSMLVDDGIVKQLNVETGPKFEVSSAETMLKQLS